jgi:hypothetical protein
MTDVVMLSSNSAFNTVSVNNACNFTSTTSMRDDYKQRYLTGHMTHKDYVPQRSRREGKPVIEFYHRLVITNVSLRSTISSQVGIPKLNYAI